VSVPEPQAPAAPSPPPQEVLSAPVRPKARSSELRQAFTPNGHVSSRVHGLLLAATLVLLFCAWSLFKPVVLPSPMEVLRAYPGLVDQGFWSELMVSLTTNFEAVALTCLLTVPLAYLTVVPAARPLVRILTKMRFLSLTGFVMPFTLLFGGGSGLKLGLLVFGTGVFLITSLYDIVDGIPREEFDHARSLGIGTWGAVWEVVVRGQAAAVIDAVRQNCAMLWVMLTLVEGLVRFQGGLGTMLLNEDKHMHLDSVFALQGAVLVVGLLFQDALFALIRRAMCPYANLRRERQ